MLRLNSSYPRDILISGFPSKNMENGAAALEQARDSEIAKVAKQRIVHQPHLSIQRIWCDFDEGRLFLRGQVPSFYFKQLAQEAVADVEGVEQVVNEIEVLW
jgi:osmotically-inducible protein OsmY